MTSKTDAVYIDGFKAGYSQARFDLEQEPCEDCVSRKDISIHKDRTVQDFADKCRECGATYGKQLKKLVRIKARYAEERGILLKSTFVYTPNNVMDIIDYIMCEDTEVEK